jgi:diaminopimelate decarboxylase
MSGGHRPILDGPGAIAPMPCLSLRDGRLFVEDCEVAELAGRFGTPLNIVSEVQLRANLRAFRRAFEASWTEGPVHVLPSIKANYALALRRVLTEEGAGCDTFGASELRAALACGVDPALISVNGTGKDEGLLREALLAGARVTADSVRELELLRAVARQLGSRATARLRVRPRYTDLAGVSDFFPRQQVPIREVAQRYKPGIPPDDLLALDRGLLSDPALDISGVHCHVARHSRRAGLFDGMITSLVELLAELRDTWSGWQPRELDLGGGFSYAGDPVGLTGLSDEELGDLPVAPTPAEYAAVLTSTVRRELTRHGFTTAGLCIEIEPGRAAYATAGLHLARVVNVKEQRDPVPRTWVETDTSEAFLPDVNLEHVRWPTILPEKGAASPTQTADIVGCSCGFDLLVPDALLPEVTPGDLVALLVTGAYQDAGANNFNALPRPAVVLVGGTQAEVIKRRETIAEVFARDVVPERLGGTPPWEPGGSTSAHRGERT